MFQRTPLLFFILLGAGTVLPAVPVFAANCLELNTCPTTGVPLTDAIYPLTVYFGTWIYVIVWGMIIGVVYIRTRSGMLTALIGVLVLSGFLGTATYTGSSTSIVFYYGLILISIAIACAAFYIIWTKSRNP